MIDLLVIIRILSDYLWEYKLVSVASVFVFLLAGVINFIHSKKYFRMVFTDGVFISFMCSVLFAEAFNPSMRSPVELAKFLAYFIIYLSGRLGPVRISRPNLLGVLSLLALSGFAIASLLEYGYQDWGSVPTFAGGYFFKTDMALSALIFLVIVTSTLSATLSFVAMMLCSYLVFKTNTRIALPLCLIIPCLALLIRGGYLRKINIKSIFYLSLAAATSMLVFIVIDFSELGLLGFDFSNPYSAANTQGRSVIWAALMDGFMGADLFRQVFGLGLGADSALTRLFSESKQLEEVRAHSSYLYLLVCTGVLGSFLFLLLIASILRHVRLLLLLADRSAVTMAVLTLQLIVTFLWVSLTTEIIIRAQLMVFVFYFSGIVVQWSQFQFINGYRNGSKLVRKSIQPQA